MSKLSENKKIPSIRFFDFSDDWKQRKLSQLGLIVTGSTPSTQVQANYSDIGIPWVTPTDISDNITFCTAKYLTNEGQRVARVVPKNTILVTSIASIGKNTILGTTGSFNQQINGLVPNNKENHSYFLFAQSTLWSDRMKRTAASGTMQIVNKTEFSEIETYVPTLDEQKLIGEYFYNLDNLITLQQHKLLKLKNIKKAMLEKMFPRKKSKTPEIRFSGFTDAWNESKFSEIFTYLQSNSLSRADLNYYYGKVKNVHYGDVLIKFGEILDVKKAEIPFISNKEFIVNNISLLQDGDIIIADAAEDKTVGKCSEIKGVEGTSIVSGLHTIPCRPNKKFATGYQGYFLNSNSYHDQLLSLIQGTKISSISKSALQNTDIFYPNSEQEQFQIGEFFRNLDNLIALQQSKYEKLKNIKKACLMKMFV